MKRFFLLSALSLLILSIPALAQRSIEQNLEGDPILEADARHNLDVAWQAFKPKRAYKQVLLRFEETYAAHPEFSRMEEFYYLAGMSSYYLSRNEGRQKVDLTKERELERYEPAKLREEAKAYLATLLEKFPETKYRPEVERTIKELDSK
ncbi:MAG: outer membrane protein assembly factor BamD [Blastocatellia bacterium]|nr:outer membrane protein assembly factor BamD [Blastocatellia bacterium]